jgi:hypothetical protein
MDAALDSLILGCLKDCQEWNEKQRKQQ